MADEEYPGSPLQFWAGILAFAVAIAVLLMISVGANVTTIRAGDSDPGWTWKFWTWFQRWMDAPGGLAHELFHRMIGTVIGFMMMGLAVLVWLGDPRRWMKILVSVVLLLVILQGLMGALRVLVVSDENVQSTVLDATGGGVEVGPRRQAFAAIHATNGHVIFGLATVLALCSTGGWIKPPKLYPAPGTARTRRLARLTLIMFGVQIILGAAARHFPSSMTVHLHMTWAFVVVVHAILLSNRCTREHLDAFPVRQPAFLLMFLTLFQVFLGFGAWMMSKETMAPPPMSLANLIRSGHVATGAMLFAMTIVITMRSFHILRPEEASPAPA